MRIHPNLDIDVEPTGDPVGFYDFLGELGIGKTRAAEMLKAEVAPPSFFIGRNRMVDRTVAKAWFAAIARGELDVESAALKRARQATKEERLAAKAAAA